jgi:hypothetical protein
VIVGWTLLREEVTPMQAIRQIMSVARRFQADATETWVARFER